MNKTRKSFLMAGSILGVISSVLMLLAGGIFLLFSPLVKTDLLVEVYMEDTVNFTAVDKDGNLTNKQEDVYAFLDNETGKQFITVSRLDDIANLVQKVGIVAGLLILGFGVATLIFSIKVIKLANTISNKNGSVITLLVLSVISGNLLTFAFMVVGLCCKNKSVDLPPLDSTTIQS